MTDEQYRQTAIRDYRKSDDIAIDSKATVSRGSEPGAWVAAWVWIEDETLPDGMGSEDDPDAAED